MKMEIFAIRDRATDQYGNPMFFVNRGQAIRSFSDEINNNTDNNMLAKHSDDFDLYHMGQYETDTGVFNTTTPTQVAIGKDLKIKP